MCFSDYFYQICQSRVSTSCIIGSSALLFGTKRQIRLKGNTHMNATRFSANLGFLWTELSLPEAIHAAKVAGFDAVECHWPYDTPAQDIHKALDATDLPMMGLNTRRGDVEIGENGLSALPDRITEAQDAINQAVVYADAVGAKAVHVMAGKATGKAAHTAFVTNLKFAASEAAKKNITILIEPLNPHDAPGYFLSSTAQAESLIRDVAAPNVKLMFDCYHVARTEGDVTTRLAALLPIIGHIQFASVPARAAPNQGELDYRFVFAEIARLGWNAPLGAEYKPGAPTETTLAWMQDLR